MGLLRKRCAELKNGLLQYKIKHVWMRNDGRILWSVAAICETYIIQSLMGRHLMRSRSAFTSKDQLFHLVQWSNITVFLAKTCRDCISSARKSYQVFSLDMLCTRGESGKETFWSQTLRNWKRLSHLKSMVKGSMQRKCWRPWWKIHLSGRKWNSQTL